MEAAVISAGGARVAIKGDICQAQFKNKWYKAKVLKVLDGGRKYKISFLTFNYVPTVNAIDIRFVADEAAVVPAPTSKEAEGHVVKTGDTCQAQFKNIWYKARVLKVLEGGRKYKISFLTFNYVLIVNAEDIRFV